MMEPSSPMLPIEAISTIRQRNFRLEQTYKQTKMKSKCTLSFTVKIIHWKLFHHNLKNLVTSLCMEKKKQLQQTIINIKTKKEKKETFFFQDCDLRGTQQTFPHIVRCN